MTDDFKHIENKFDEISSALNLIRLDDNERKMSEEMLDDLKLMLLTAKMSGTCKSGIYASAFFSQTEQRLFNRLSAMTLYVAENLSAMNSDYRHYGNLYETVIEIERAAIGISSCYEHHKH